MSKLVALVLVLAACGKSSPPDPTKAKCAPHWKMEMDCADPETRKALVLVGDMCQKALNGKNPQVFGPTARKRMEDELACAIASPDCKSYAICKDGVGAEPTP